MLPVNGFLMRPRSRNAQQEGRRRAPKTDNKVDPAERPGLPSCSSLIFFRSDMRKNMCVAHHITTHEPWIKHKLLSVCIGPVGIIEDLKYTLHCDHLKV